MESFEEFALSGESEIEVRHLLFRVGGELYGAPLTQIKEVLKVPSIMPVPYMTEYFTGIINLRGEVIGVIDLRKKFGRTAPALKTDIILIIETLSGSLGVIIDDLVSVEKIPDNDIQHDLPVKVSIQKEFFLGVAHWNSQLIHVINIAGCLSTDELCVVKKTKE